MSLTATLNKKLQETLQDSFWEGVKACFECFDTMDNETTFDEVKDAIMAHKFAELFSGTTSKPEKKTSTSSKKEVAPRTKSRKSVPLPFCGQAVDHWCDALKFNYGLYTQCMNNKPKDSDFCCEECEENAEEKYGSIHDRMADYEKNGHGFDYRDIIKKAKAKSYTSVIKRMNLTNEEIYGEIDRRSELIEEEWLFDSAHMYDQPRSEKSTTKAEKEEPTKKEVKKETKTIKKEEKEEVKPTKKEVKSNKKEEKEIKDEIFEKVSTEVKKSKSNKKEKEEEKVELDLKQLSSKYNTPCGLTCYQNQDKKNKSEIYIKKNNKPELIGHWNSETRSIDFLQEEEEEVQQEKVEEEEEEVEQEKVEEEEEEVQQEKVEEEEVEDVEVTFSDEEEEEEEEYDN